MEKYYLNILNNISKEVYHCNISHELYNKYIKMLRNNVSPIIVNQIRQDMMYQLNNSSISNNILFLQDLNIKTKPTNTKLY